MTNRNLPWAVPVPVKRANFEPLDPAHDEWSVTVDLGRIHAFARRPNVDDTKIAYCDLQTNVDSNFERRLGSGRAVAYNGFYLKGVGRTQLAGNWNSDDVYHASGTQLPSAAAREFVVTRLLETHACVHAVVPCIGVLGRKLPSTLRGLVDDTFGRDPNWLNIRASMPRFVDDHVQAITAKHGDFARASNFVWWIANFPQMAPCDSSVAAFFRLLIAFAYPSSMRPRDARNASPKSAANAIAGAMRRTIEYFYDAWSAGVSWGSLHNNFTLDGRFLDLETPKIHNAPLWGVQLRSEARGASLPTTFVMDEPQAQFVGAEVGIIASQLLRFRAFLSERIRFFRQVKLVHPIESEFFAEFDRELSLAIGPQHPLSSLDSLAQFASQRISRTLELTRKERELVRERFVWINRERFSRCRESAPQRPRALRIRRLDGPSAKPEPLLLFDTYVPDFVYERVRDGVEANMAANEMLLRADATTNVSKWLEVLRQPLPGRRRFRGVV